jgi:hypothetical protein
VVKRQLRSLRGALLTLIHHQVRANDLLDTTTPGGQADVVAELRLNNRLLTQIHRDLSAKTTTSEGGSTDTHPQNGFLAAAEFIDNYDANHPQSEQRTQHTDVS